MHITHEKKSDGHHLVMPVIITFQVMGPSLQKFKHICSKITAKLDFLCFYIFQEVC